MRIPSLAIQEYWVPRLLCAPPWQSGKKVKVRACDLLRKVLNVKSNFIGKKELFVGPFGWYLRAMGGAPIDRSSSQNKVEAIAKLFDQHDEFRLALAPEGTRKKVDQWRTGFYYIAKAAKVPIIMFTLDFENKQNKISEPFYPTDNVEADFKFMKGFFEGVKGKVPEYS